MGQAKLRGSKEQRVAQAVDREAAKTKPLPRKVNPRSAMLLAMAAGLVSGTLPPARR